jgi:hypothetical protein
VVKQVYSNDLIKLFEDIHDLDGEEKIYTIVFVPKQWIGKRVRVSLIEKEY